MKLSSAKLPDTVHCPSSKSYAARALILAALKPTQVTLTDLPMAQDTLDLLNALNLLGLKIKQKGAEILVQNSFPACEGEAVQLEINLGEGGTTARFILPLLALGKNSYQLKYLGHLNDRPMHPLYDTLKSLGAKIELTPNGVSIQGPIKLEGLVAVDCSYSSQFGSAIEHLKLIKNFEVDYKNLNHSQSYLAMSKKLVQEFSNKDEFAIPADFSSLGYFIAWAIFRQDLIIENIFKPDPLQADNQIFSVLDQIGAHYQLTSNGLQIRKMQSFQKGFEMDGSTCIDLIPTLMFIASYLPFQSQIKNIEKLKYKECDRLAECLNILNAFKVDFSFDKTEDTLVITGVAPKVVNLSYQTQNDHRMVMMASLFIKHNGTGQIWPKDAVRKSFPNFFDYFH